MAKLDQEALAQIVNAVMASLQGQGAASTKPAPQFKNSFGRFDPIAKDRSLISAFSRRGFKVTLMDRNDPTKPYDVKPFKAWIKEGRIVRRGERGVRGLFHVSQTDPIQPKGEMTPQRKAMFRKAKAKLTPVS
jgi:hypothetical protein